MQKRYCFLFFGFLLLLNCTKKEKIKHEVYIISKAESDYKKMLKESKNQTTPPPPPRGTFAYGSNNFIIDKDTNLFYFQQPSFFICGTGAENDTVPRLMEFKKEDFIQIPRNSIREFVLLNLKDSERHFTHIASQIDTLNFDLFFDLIHAVNKPKIQKDRDSFIIRRTTQEEDSIIGYKKSGKSYYYSNIKWDTTRIDTVHYKFIERD
ncbi:hypothetical protein [Flavobacterium soli]|uniref:hypothetical protein n=1 Tax=Flavobacterium soli TaxID=344881 RepID=UPI00041FEE51|nr:hypothetical protein [Flavobacterium soli]